MEKNSKASSSAMVEQTHAHLLGKWEELHRHTITDMTYYTAWALHKVATMNGTLDDFTNAESAAFVAKFNEQNDLFHNQGERPLIIRVRDLAGAMRDNHYKLRYEYFSNLRIHVTLFLMTAVFIEDSNQFHDPDIKLVADLRDKSLCLGKFKQEDEWYESAGVNPCSSECVHADKSYYGIQSKSASGEECLKWKRPKISQMYELEFKNNITMDWNHSFCRNPNKDESGPWCYVSTTGLRKYCHVHRACPVSSCCSKIRITQTPAPKGIYFKILKKNTRSILLYL
jgi:hypothetical protein